nr:SsrA-binding protein SmpB [Desulfovibrio sp.]
GPEVKSARAGQANFVDSYVDFREGQAWLQSLHIAPYANGGYAVQDPDRPKLLLLHGREISRLASLVAQKGFTVVPTRLYFKNRLIKVEIALGKGKKLYDHRETLKRRAEEMDQARDMS